MYVYACVYIYIYVRMYVYKCMCVYICTGGKQWQTTPKNVPRIQCARAIPVTWLGSGSCQVRPSRLNTNEWNNIYVHMYVYVCMYVVSIYVRMYMYVCIHVYVCMYVFTYLCNSICMYVCMHESRMKPHTQTLQPMQAPTVKMVLSKHSSGKWWLKMASGNLQWWLQSGQRRPPCYTEFAMGRISEIVRLLCKYLKNSFPSLETCRGNSFVGSKMKLQDFKD